MKDILIKNAGEYLAGIKRMNGSYTQEQEAFLKDFISTKEKDISEDIEQSPERVSVDAGVSVPEIRNKLTPISNLVAMIEDVNVTVTFSSREYGQMFQTEIEEVKKSLKELAH